MSRNLVAGINETKLIEYCLLHRYDICWVAFENVIEMNVISDRFSVVGEFIFLGFIRNFISSYIHFSTI